MRFTKDILIVWTTSENELKSFINETNKKNYSIEFDFKFSKEKIEFLDTLVYKDHSKQHFIKNQLTAKSIFMQNLHILFH